MKVTELKVGDWVMCNSKPLRIAEINLFLCTAWDKDEGFHGNISIYHLIPIPLTPEILKKNGWEEKKKEFSEGVIYTNGWYVSSKSEEGGFWMFSHYDDFLTTIKYVHQLQHLLWALGIDDDLKI